MYWPDIPVKSAAVGLKASLIPMAGSTDLRLNLFCILNLWTPNRKLFPSHLPPCRKKLLKRSSNCDSWCMILTWVGKYPSLSCAGRCPRMPDDERWAGTRGTRAASSSHWAGPPAGSARDPGTAAPARCNADLMTSWTDLRRRAMSSGVTLMTFSNDLLTHYFFVMRQSITQSLKSTN